MTLSRVKTIRSLERGLSVLQLLHRLNGASLQDLHDYSGLPKATLQRLLLTLQYQGFAAQRIVDGCWVLGTASQNFSKRLAPSDRLSQVAAPVLDRLCRTVIWPSDLSVRVGTHMELKETSRPHSRLSLGSMYVGFQINILHSAPGRAYLAFCPDAEREAVLRRVRTEGRPGHEAVTDQAFMARILETTRRNGFAVREPSFGGHITKPKSAFDDNLNAIAAPVLNGAKVLGCINIIWIRRLATQKEIARRHLDHLLRAAAEIGQNYSRMDRLNDTSDNV